MTTNTNPTRPPKCGPFARPKWNRRESRWDRRLTAAGKRLVEKFLESYPDPALILYRLFPKDAATVRAFGHTDDDIRQGAFVGTLRAAATFDPRFGTKFVTHAALHIRSNVQRMIPAAVYSERRRGRAYPIAYQLFDASASKDDRTDIASVTADDLADHRHPTPPEAMVVAADVAWVRETLRKLPPREGDICLRRYRGQTLKEIGDAHGITKERVRQLLRRAELRLAKLLRPKQRQSIGGHPSVPVLSGP